MQNVAVHVVVFVGVAIVCNVQVHEACMHADYQGDTGNDRVQVHEENVCADVDYAAGVQHAIVVRQESTAEKQESAQNVVQPCSAHGLHEADGRAVHSDSDACKTATE